MIHGRVLDARGLPVPFAEVLVTAADAACAIPGHQMGGTADASGAFEILLENGVGPSVFGCAIVEARSGGAGGEVRVPARFTSSVRDRVPVEADVRLTERSPLTRAEAARLVQLLEEAINSPSSTASAELSRFIAGGPEALRVAVEQYRTVLGRVVDSRELREEGITAAAGGYRRVIFELLGSTGRTMEIDVYQDDLVRLHGLLLDYGLRSELFINAFLRAISSGDGVRLARILSPDDIDFPVERAREIIVSYREHFHTATLRAEFMDADDQRHTIRWMIRGRTPAGPEETGWIELITGDGLIGVRSSGPVQIDN